MPGSLFDLLPLVAWRKIFAEDISWKDRQICGFVCRHWREVTTDLPEDDVYLGAESPVIALPPKKIRTLTLDQGRGASASELHFLHETQVDTLQLKGRMGNYTSNADLFSPWHPHGFPRGIRHLTLPREGTVVRLPPPETLTNLVSLDLSISVVVGQLDMRPLKSLESVAFAPTCAWVLPALRARMQQGGGDCTPIRKLKLVDVSFLHLLNRLHVTSYAAFQAVLESVEDLHLLAGHPHYDGWNTYDSTETRREARNVHQDVLIDFLRQCRNLRRVELEERYRSGVADARVHTILKNTVAPLKALSVKLATHLSAATYRVLLPLVHQMEELKLFHASEPVVPELLDRLPGCDSMQVLAISNCPQFSERQLRTIARTMPNLHHLDLSGSGQVPDLAIVTAVRQLGRLQRLSYRGQLIDATTAALLDDRGIQHACEVVRPSHDTSAARSRRLHDDDLPELEAHVKELDGRVFCSLCDFPLPEARDLQDHLLICEATVVDCLMASSGCTFRAPRAEMHKHLGSPSCVWQTPCPVCKTHLHRTAYAEHVFQHMLNRDVPPFTTCMFRSSGCKFALPQFHDQLRWEHSSCCAHGVAVCVLCHSNRIPPFDTSVAGAVCEACFSKQSSAPQQSRIDLAPYRGALTGVETHRRWRRFWDHFDEIASSS